MGREHGNTNEKYEIRFDLMYIQNQAVNHQCLFKLIIRYNISSARPSQIIQSNT